MLVRIAAEISLDEALTHIRSPLAGGENIFVGRVRDHSAGRKVRKLQFECYEAMALSEMERIASGAMRGYEVHDIAILHVTGEKFPGEEVVIIAVSAAHRDAAFAACRFCIDRLKEQVPIWKKEFFEGGEVWVSAFP